MDRRLLAFGVVLLALCALIVTTVVVAFVGIDSVGGDYDVVWESESASEYTESHHAVAVASGSELTLAVPANDVDAETGDGASCGLAALDGAGETGWQTDVADGDDCTPHGVGGVTTAEFADGTAFVAADQTGHLRAYDADSGDVLFTYELNHEGYAAPVVADVTGDGADEIVVTDFSGTIHVVDANGDAVWTRSFEGTTPTGPLVGDFTENGQTDVAIALRDGGKGRLVALDADGEELWTTTAGSGITSWTFASVDDGAGSSPVIVAGVGSGDAVAYEAGSGDIRWEAPLQGVTVRVGETSPGRVHVTGTGTVWSLDLEDGNIIWRQQIGDQGRMAPPVVGDVTGDGSLDVAVVGTGGTVGVVSVSTGSVSGLTDTGDAFYSRPTLVDVTGDGSLELVLLRDDGRVVVLSLQK